jgi:PKD domain
MLQATAAKQPISGTKQINGLNAISFDGTDDALMTAANPFGSSVQNAMMMGAFNIGTLSDSTLFSLTGSTASRWQSHAPYSDGTLYFDCAGGASPNRVQVASGWSANTNKLLGFYCSTTDNVQQVWESGKLKIGDTSGHTASTSAGIALGHDGVSSYDNCSMGEVVIINGVVSNGNREVLEGYLAHKWGFASTLLGTHPYKAAPLGAGSVVNVSGVSSTDPDNDPLTYTWSVVSGSAGVMILDAKSKNTSLYFTALGSYTLRLTVSDGYSQTSDDIVFNVVPNQAPTASAGANQSVALSDWTPEALNLMGWYDATDTTTITQTGGAVSQWRSKNGTSHMVQTTSTKQPITGTQQINGFNAIAFDGTDDGLKTATNPFGSTIQDAMIMGVINIGTLTSSTLYSLTGSDAARWQAHAPFSDGNIYYDVGGSSATNRVQVASGWSANQNKLLGFYCSTTDNVQQIWDGGTLKIGDTTGHSVNTNSGMALGYDGSGTSFDNCKMGEVVILQGVVSNENRQKIEGYLAKKWGMTTNLPSNHPYKTAPPRGVGVNLVGTASDANNEPLTYTWTLISGPLGAAIVNSNSLNARLVAEVNGTYVLRLTVSDGVTEATDEVTVTVENQAPVVNAGADQSVAMAAWGPAALNPVAWYDATDTSTITQSAGAVSEWRSKAGTSHLLQGTSSKRPSTGTMQINGLNALGFDGTDDALKTATNPFGSSIQNAMFMAVTNLGTNTASTLFSLSGSSTNANRFQAHCPFSDSIVYFDTGGASGANRVQSTSTLSANQTRLLGFYGSVTDNVQQVWNSGTLLKGDATGHAVSTQSGIALGNDGSTNHDNCTMGEVVIINGVVTAANRQRLEGYLSHKWSLASTLPAAHPYKVAPPDAAIISLGGTASDGNNDPLTYQWSVLNGPTDYALYHANSPNPTLVSNVTGTYTLRLTVSDGVSQSTDDITISAGTLTPYQTWASGPFTHPFTLTDVMEDPDKDGAENLLEFAFGTDPTHSAMGRLSFVAGGNMTSPGLPLLLIQEGQPNAYRAIFARRKNHAAAGITYDVMFSADMLEWTSSSAGLSVVTAPNSSGEMEVVSVPFPVSVPLSAGGTGEPTFFRIAVRNN